MVKKWLSSYPRKIKNKTKTIIIKKRKKLTWSHTAFAYFKSSSHGHSLQKFSKSSYKKSEPYPTKNFSHVQKSQWDELMKANLLWKGINWHHQETTLENSTYRRFIAIRKMTPDLKTELSMRESTQLCSCLNGVL